MDSEAMAAENAELVDYVLGGDSDEEVVQSKEKGSKSDSGEWLVSS